MLVRIAVPCYLPDDVGTRPLVAYHSRDDASPGFVDLSFKSKDQQEKDIGVLQQPVDLLGGLRRTGDKYTLVDLPAVIYGTGQSVGITWMKDGIRFEVSSTRPRAEIIRIAESVIMGCPDTFE